MARIIGIVPARGGSVGIPGKHLRPLAESPLIDWTLTVACQACDHVVVTTDDPAIYAHAQAWPAVCKGYTVADRPAILATSRTPDLPVVRHAYEEIGSMQPDDVIVLLRPTAPFRRVDEIRDVLLTLGAWSSDSVRSVVRATGYPQKTYLQMGWTAPDQADDRYPILEPATGPRHRANHPRQSLPEAWRACGFIDAVRADVLVGCNSLEGDLILGWPAPIERALDIDDEDTWRAAEALAQARNWRPGECA